MKVSFGGAVAVAILILVAAAAYGKEAPAAAEPEVISRPPNRKSAEDLNKVKEPRAQTPEAKKEEAEQKLREQEKKAKLEKIQRKTGRTPSSWQVLNR
jgi:hypothetical protein